MDLKRSFALPTLDNLKLDAALLTEANIDAKEISSSWLSTFSQHITQGDIDGLIDLFIVPSNGVDAYWRDMLALTWDLRSFAGIKQIAQFLRDRLPLTRPKSFSLAYPELISLQRPFPDLAWIQVYFTFDVGDVGLASGIARLVPVRIPDTDEILWKAHSVFTNLEGLQGFPEKVGSLRPVNAPNIKIVPDILTVEDPTVLIIGGAQAGLGVAARLKALGVKNLVLERDSRIGGNWRSRYTSLSLHDPVWYDHMPYLPFPATWPVFSPATKMANWLELYADTLDLDIILSTTVANASFDAKSRLWTVTAEHSASQDNIARSKRVFQVRHVVFASGLFGGQGKIPTYPGMDIFKGKYMHSLQYKTPTEFSGKKVVVVGSCTSAHDIAEDFCNNGIDVTMYQRGSTCIMSTARGLKIVMKGLYEENGPPTDFADRINASFSMPLNLKMSQKQWKLIAGADKDLIDALNARGFRTNDGYLESGFFLLAWTRGGGYYLDTGASQMIIDGRIKLKNDSLIEAFTEGGIRFQNGDELPADVVVFATGFGDPKSSIRQICGDELADKMNPVWGLDEEGEMNGLYKDMGIPGLWCTMGNLATCRFHSKHIALQIKAMEENRFSSRYN